MKLYRIRRKDTGQFFARWWPYKEPYFTASGIFFRRIDTVAAHLQALTSDWSSDGWLRDSMRRRKIKKHYPERLKRYEVVINDVTIKGEEVIQASALMKKRKKKGTPHA